MQRGHHSIYTALLKPITEDVKKGTEKRKGRSELHNRRRNELLICRYYFHIKIVGLQYQNALDLLQLEFFISERTIVDIVQRNIGKLKYLHRLKPDARFFKNKFPWLIW